MNPILLFVGSKMLCIGSYIEPFWKNQRHKKSQIKHVIQCNFKNILHLFIGGIFLRKLLEILYKAVIYVEAFDGISRLTHSIVEQTRFSIFFTLYIAKKLISR